MTIVVGVLCQDGVIVGSDSAYTFTAGNIKTVEQPGKKIEIVGDDHLIVAGTGQLGLSQRFTAIVADAWSNKVFQKSPIEIGKSLAASAIQDFSSTRAPTQQYGALVAFPCHRTPQLCEFSITDFQPELKTPDMWYVSMGSGQAIVDPFLGLIRKVFWKDGVPSRQDAIFAVYWALAHAIDVNPGGINSPIHIAELYPNDQSYKARMLSMEELDDHRSNMEGAEEHLGGYRGLVGGGAEARPVDLPKP